MSELKRNQFPTLPSKDFFDLVELIYKEHTYLPEESGKETMITLIKDHSKDHDIIFYHVQAQSRLIGLFPHEGEWCQFAFFESIENPVGLKLMFDAFHHDAIERGFKEVKGPYHFSTFHRYRTRLTDSSWNQFNGEPVNPPYYEALLTSQQYSSDTQFESRFIETTHIPDFYLDKKDFVKSVTEIPFNFHVLDAAFWRKREEDIFQLIIDIFSQNPGFKNINFDGFKKLYNPLYANKLCPHTSVVFEEKSTGKLAAICLAHPNYKSLSIAPDFVPDYKTHYSQLTSKTLLIKTIGVHPNFRRNNLMSYLGAYGMLNFKEYYDQCIFCLMREDNFSLKFSEGLPFQSTKYALFNKLL